MHGSPQLRQPGCWMPFAMHPLNSQSPAGPAHLAPRLVRQHGKVCVGEGGVWLLEVQELCGLDIKAHADLYRKGVVEWG